MADFAPPSGPPPPKVPEGWKAVWNSQYNEWFYVNIHTKKSQWDKPTEPVYAAPTDGAPPGAPPSYDHNSAQHTGPEKGGFGSNNPYGGSANISEDERLARQLQAEEEARARPGGSGTSGNRGASDSYYGGGNSASPYGQPANAGSPAPGGQSTNKGFFSKLSSKFGGGSSQQRPPQQYGGGYPPQQGGYGGGPGYYPPQQQGGYYPPQQQYYPQQQQGYYQQQPQRKHGGGLGAGGGALLGAGAGLIGGAMLMDAIDDNQQEAYQEGYEDGGGGDDFGGDDGGDF